MSACVHERVSVHLHTCTCRCKQGWWDAPVVRQTRPPLAAPAPTPYRVQALLDEPSVVNSGGTGGTDVELGVKTALPIFA